MTEINTSTKWCQHLCAIFS